MLDTIIKNKSAIYLAVLIVVTLLVTTKDITEGEFRYTDASRHAMDGVYFSDVLHDLPWANLYDYTVQYYAKYPALALFYYYPPFFALVEGFFFLAFGISVVTARFTVVFFALIAVIGWYQLVKEMYDERHAFYSSMLLITMPFVVFWSRHVMLEIPALALVILCCYFFYNFIEADKRRHAYYLGISLILAGLTKQHTLFLFAFFVLYALFRRRLTYFLRKEMIVAGLVAIIVLTPIYFTMMKTTVLLFKDGVGAIGPLDLKSKLSLSDLFYYPSKLPQIVTIPIVILAGLSIVFTMARPDRRGIFFMLWLGSSYLLLIALQIKDLRYAFMWIPPLVLFAASILLKLPWKIKNVPVSTLMLLPLCLFQLGYQLDTPFVSGYEEAARFVVENRKGDTVLFDGWLDGHFIFQVRKHDKDKEMIVLRGRKLLYSSPFSDLDPSTANSYVQSRNDILDLLCKYGTKYVVVENEDVVNIPPTKLLRATLNSDDFRLVKKIPVVSTLSKLENVSLLIYEYKKDVRMTAETLTLPMLGIGKRFVVPTKALKGQRIP